MKCVYEKEHAASKCEDRNIFKIAKDEFFYTNKFNSRGEVISNLGKFPFEYNHLRMQGELNYEMPFGKLQEIARSVSQYRCLFFFEELLNKRFGALVLSFYLAELFHAVRFWLYSNGHKR